MGHFVITIAGSRIGLLIKNFKKGYLEKNVFRTIRANTFSIEANQDKTLCPIDM